MTRLQKCEILKKKGFSYNALTGKIYNRFGKEMTRKAKNGYTRISGGNNFKGDLYSHHFAWFYIYGNVDFNQLDHINRDRSDNRICNLRIITNQENQFNTSAKGYYWNKQNKKWLSRIQVNGKRIHLGYFNTEDEARQAYINAKEKLHKIDG